MSYDAAGQARRHELEAEVTTLKTRYAELHEGLSLLADRLESLGDDIDREEAAAKIRALLGAEMPKVGMGMIKVYVRATGLGGMFTPDAVIAARPGDGVRYVVPGHDRTIEVSY